VMSRLGIVLEQGSYPYRTSNNLTLLLRSGYSCTGSRKDDPA
jgi:hypothetical protein